FYYEYYNDTTCLVEADEEPPHDICDEAIDICLTMANFLDSTSVDEIHPMRKIVIDGSNTTGFQRTAIISTGGKIKVNGKEIGIQAIGLEEDAARKIADDDKNNARIYRLDRLGIPLIEIATAPDIRTPSEAQEVALVLGLLLRSTGKVKRGLGTIRQDVNVSIRGGGIMEIKGLQQLDMLSTVVELEALRQERLLEIRDILVARNIQSEDIDTQPLNVTEIFSESTSKVIKNALMNGGTVFGVKLPGFAGLVGKEIQPNRRLGTELSDYAKFWGDVSGIFHTDELPKYGITEEEVSKLRRHFGAKELDAVIIVAAPEKDCINALEAVVKRAQEAVKGVPAETRISLPTGASKYARPRPGASRMYPETDVRPVKILPSRLKRIKKEMPETLENKEQRFIREHELSEDLAFQITRSPNLNLYETITNEFDISNTLVAATLTSTLTSMHRDSIPTQNLQEQHFTEMFQFISDKKITTDAITGILTYIAKNPQSDTNQALESTGLGLVDSSDIENIVQRIIEERIDFVREQGEKSIGGLMGIAMKELRGKADGKIVKNLITVKVNKILNE
ncbi:MAG: Glu-tRNA(Gln) amidotransferase subunit GatE, partial [Candidatus Thorarchaeota archaeon]